MLRGTRGASILHVEGRFTAPRPWGTRAARSTKGRWSFRGLGVRALRGLLRDAGRFARAGRAFCRPRLVLLGQREGFATSGGGSPPKLTPLGCKGRSFRVIYLYCVEKVTRCSWGRCWWSVELNLSLSVDSTWRSSVRSRQGGRACRGAPTALPEFWV